jgi:hypothetical protein
LVGAIPLNPAYFINGSFSEYTPFYEQFRFRRLRFIYVTSSSTTYGGEVFMYVDENPSVAALNSAGSAFPSKLMSTANAMMGPLWTNMALDYVPGSKDFKLLNPLTNESMEESTYGTFYIYQTNPAVAAGYVMVDEEVEFIGKRNTGYQTPLSYITPYTYVTNSHITDISATPAQGTDVTVATYFPAPSVSIPGTIYKCILDSGNSAYGSNSGNAWQLSYYTASATSISLTNGTVFYALVVSATQTKLYWTYLAATSGFVTASTNQTNAIQYGNGGTRSGYALWYTIVYAPASQSLGN